MLILGISTSSKYPSAAVSQDGEMLSFVCDKTPFKSHSETLMGIIEEALARSGRCKEDLSAIAVDVGPGSFTGVRIGVSCANAMAAALSVPVIPVCSLNAMRRAAGEDGAVAALIDCRNGNCYAAVFENGAEKLAPCAAVTEEVLGDLPENCAVLGDIGDRAKPCAPDARLVLLEAANNPRECSEAVPMYLRPSQAERMKNG